MAFNLVPLLRGFTEVKSLWSILNLTEEPIGFICGGYARYCCSQAKKVFPASDCDVFPTNTDTYNQIKEKLLAVGLTVKHENEISILMGPPNENPESVIPEWRFIPKPQIIKPVIEGKIVTMGSVEEILGNFDFTITRAAILNPTTCFVDEDFMEDENRHVLQLKNIHCPVSSLLRCLKYAKKGYWMRPSEALKLFNDWDDRGEDYKINLIELFRKSFAKDADGKQIEMEKKEIDELERLLRID